MIQSFADIMEQSGALSHSGIQPQLGCHHARKISHFQRMVQNVLTIACTVTQPAQQLY